MSGTGTLRAFTVALVTLSLLGGCSRGAPLFGFPAKSGIYKAKLSTERGARRNFTVTVRPVSAGIQGALEEGRFKATEYCVRNFGGSEIDWRVGPETPANAVPVIDDKLQLAGACAKR